MSIFEMTNRLTSLVGREKGTGATSQEIADAERAVGARLPTSYRAFLSMFGWARLYHDPIYGVGASVPHPYSLVSHAISERTLCEPSMPEHLVPVMNDGAGNHYCLDTSRLEGDECPVVFWDHEHQDGPAQVPAEVSASFDKWLVDRIVNSPYADDV